MRELRQDKLKLKEQLEAEEAERQRKAQEAQEAEATLNAADEEADLLAEQLQQLEAKILHNEGLGDANAEEWTQTTASHFGLALV